jgi:hypothetical protein
MTDKTPEITLNQLTAALVFLADHWETWASSMTRYPESRSREENIAAVNLFGAFTQSSTALRLLVDKIKELPANASSEDVKATAIQSSKEAGDVWD